MNLVVFGAVMFSALCHAAWNTLVKGWSDDRLTATALMFMWIALIALPFLFVVEAPSAELWPYLAAAVAFFSSSSAALTTASISPFSFSAASLRSALTT